MKKYLILILFLSLITILVCGCEGTGVSKTEELVTNTNESGSVYEVSEYLDDTQFDEYMNDDGVLFGKLKAFQRRLADSMEFEFYAYANNPVEIINQEIPDICMVNHGTEYEDESRYEMDGEKITAAEAIQVSDRFFELFPLRIIDGRGFEPSDFNSRNAGPIPVILGNAYRDAFQPGDTFEGYYILEQKTFSVIGFTDTESDFYLRCSNCMAPYGHFIIMPFENIEEDSFSARAILLQQVCGFMVPHNGREPAADTIREYLMESGLENWRDAIVVFEKSLQDKMK